MGCVHPSLNNQQVAEPSPEISKLTLSVYCKLLKYLTRGFWKTVCRWVPWVAEVLIKSITSNDTEGLKQWLLSYFKAKQITVEAEIEHAM